MTTAQKEQRRRSRLWAKIKPANTILRNKLQGYTRHLGTAY